MQERKPKLLFEDRPVATPPTHLWRGLLIVLLLFAGTRLVTWIGAYHGAWTLFRIEHQIDPPLEQHIPELEDQFVQGSGPEFETATDLLVDFMPLCRFDGIHYKSIIEGGYQYTPPPPGTTDRRELEQNIAFFPLYPLLVKPFTAFLTTHAAMILVTHLCTLTAAVLIFLWIRRRIDQPVALCTVAITLCWPASVYYSFAYAEAVTLVTCVIALWLIDARKWWAAAIVCGLVTASRPTALAIVGVLALTYWLLTDLPRGKRVTRLMLLCVIGGAGIAGYALYLTIEFGSPFVYFANFKAGWVPEHRRADWLAFLTLTPVWEQFKYFRDLVAFAPPVGLLNAPNTLMWNMPLNLFVLFLSLAGLRRVPASFRPLLALGPLIFLHAYIAGGGAKFGIEPIARYTAVAIPAFVVLAAWMIREWRPAPRTAVFVFFVLIQAAWAYRFGLREWSG